MKKLRVALILVLAISMLFGLANAELVLNDMLGQEVKLAQPAEKIVVLQPADCEILCELGLADKIVGRGEYCNYPEEIMQVPAVSSGSETNVEQIIALESDLVIMTKMSQNPETSKKIQEAGISVLVTDAQDFNGIYTAIELLAKATNTEDKAKEVVSNMQNTIDELSAKKLDTAKTVYFEVSPLEYGLWTAANNTFMNEMAQLLGAQNIFADIDGWQQVSQEQVIEKNPDYIITTSGDYGQTPGSVDEIKAREAWKNINAVVNNNVYMVDSDIFSRPAPRIVEALKALYDILNK